MSHKMSHNAKQHQDKKRFLTILKVIEVRLKSVRNTFVIQKVKERVKHDLTCFPLSCLIVCGAYKFTGFL